MFSVESINFRPYPTRFREFRQSPTQPIGRHLYRCGRKLRGLARRTAPRKSGALAKSINILRYNRGFSNPSIEIGSSLRYAYYVHEGTRPHRINARTGRVMRFKHNGKIIYARKVNHPGTKPTKFLSRHLRESIT